MKFAILTLSALMATHSNAVPNDLALLKAIGKTFLSTGRTFDRSMVAASTGQHLGRGSYTIDNSNSTGLVAARNEVINGYFKLGKTIDEIVVKATGLDNNNGTDSALYENDNSGLSAIVAALGETVNATVDTVAQVLGTPEGNTTACQPTTLAN